MRKKLRVISLAMALAAVVFVVIAFCSMGSTVTLPFPAAQLHAFYKGYLLVTAGLFLASFFVRARKD